MQAMLGAFVLFGAIAYPQAGATALAIPVTARDLRWLGDAQIVGQSGRGAGMLVRAGSDGTALAALASGWLLLHVPMTLCGQNRPRRT